MKGVIIIMLGALSLGLGAAKDISNIVSGIKQENINKGQLKLQQDQHAYQKELNSLQMEREDNAYQRQAADMKAAGINPLMAGIQGGAAAGGMNAAQANAIPAEGGPKDVGGGMLAGMQLMNEDRQIEQQKKLQQAQINKMEAETIGQTNINETYEEDQQEAIAASKQQRDKQAEEARASREEQRELREAQTMRERTQRMQDIQEILNNLGIHTGTAHFEGGVKIPIFKKGHAGLAGGWETRTFTNSNELFSAINNGEITEEQAYGALANFQRTRTLEPEKEETQEESEPRNNGRERRSIAELTQGIARRPLGSGR